MLRYVIGIITMGCVAISSAQAAPEDIKFPKNYETDFINYVSVDRANGKQAARIFGNKTAIEGVKKNGEYPYGSVLLMEVSKIKLGADKKPVKANGRFIRVGKAVFVVMKRIKGTDKNIPDNLKNGDWEYAVFSKDGKFLKKNVNTCRACHARKKDAKFVFSHDHLILGNMADYLKK